MATFTTNGIKVTFEDHSQEVLEALANAVNRGLAACGERAVKHAQDLVPVDTGRLKGDISYKVEGEDCYIGTNVEYAAYVEFGTGKHSELGGRQTPWVYMDGNGEFHYVAEGRQPKPFLRPAASDHTEEYKNILRESLKNA